MASSWSVSNPIETSISLLDSVYGPVTSPDHPLPMPKDEAGLCSDNKQRRYLWTDAFGVLAYVSLADAFAKNGDKSKAQVYRQAADRLVDVVHQCLGNPRSTHRTDDAMLRDPTSPTGHVGLRIGKVTSRRVTDYGMSYDGQYWHYMDKWLLALARAGRVSEGIQIAKSVFPHFFDAGPNGDGWDGGIRWKLSVDATPPPGLERAHASDDTLVALIVFSILEHQRQQKQETQSSSAKHLEDNASSLSEEIGLLETALQYYRPRVTDDPLGWGLEALYDQFLQGHPRQAALKSLHKRALHPSHLSLPFRLYGAMIGARMAGERVAPVAMVDQLVELSLQHEAKAMARGHEEHSSINRVMLAMCLLCPGALGRQPGDPLLALP